MVHLVTDSSSDLPQNLINKYNISVVPLTINIDGTEYLEGVNIVPQQFFEMMAESKSLPKTSQPSPAAFSDVFNKLDGEILCLTISSGLSGTFQSACLAKELSDKTVTVFDTLSGSLAHGSLLLKAAELLNENCSPQQTVDRLSEYRKDMNILILLDTLENIVKGGRLSRFKGSIAKILDIKVLLEGIDGKVEMIDKIRGKKRLYEHVLNMIGQRKKDFSNVVFGITHANNLEDAEFLKSEIIKRYNPKEVLINFMGATMGTYAGKGGIIISFY